MGMIRERDDAVRTFIKTTVTPVMPPMSAINYWEEVSAQVNALLGAERTVKLAKLIAADKVIHALYRKSEQSRVDLIIHLQRSGKL